MIIRHEILFAANLANNNFQSNDMTIVNVAINEVREIEFLHLNIDKEIDKER